MSHNEPEDEERGVIINTASIAAFEGQIGQVAYTAAKAGIAGMCLTMARDLGSLGIRVLAIAPSLFATGLTKGIPDEFASALTKDAAFPKRLGRPEEYAKLVAAIVDIPMLNGQCLAWTPGNASRPSDASRHRRPDRPPVGRQAQLTRLFPTGQWRPRGRPANGIALTDDHRELAKVARGFLTSQKARAAARSRWTRPRRIARRSGRASSNSAGWPAHRRGPRRLWIRLARTRGRHRRTRSGGGAWAVRADRHRLGGDRQRRYRRAESRGCCAGLIDGTVTAGIGLDGHVMGRRRRGQR